MAVEETGRRDKTQWGATPWGFDSGADALSKLAEGLFIVAPIIKPAADSV